MKKKIFTALFLIAVSVFSLLAMPTNTLATVGCPSGSKRGQGTQVDSLAECNIEKDDSLMTRLNTIINVVLGVVGLVTVVMIIIGGVWMIISNGDPNKSAKGRQTIIWGVVGMLIALLAFAIVNFVLKGIFS